jgi:pSer/pThr/pTyr-binding forkhead associated (FHA) protein
MHSGRFRGPEPQPEVQADPSAGAVSRYWVRFGAREIPLDGGDTFIGRGDGCQILVNEALVSRKHARIVLDGGRPYIEDLGSANGTFVNQARLHGRALLFPGDHVFVGTCEIEIIRRVEEDRPTMPQLDPGLDRPTPASGVGAFEPASSVRAPRSSARTAVDTSRPSEPTTEVDAFEYLGRLADKMFTMGRVDAALKILASNLQEILSSARAGKMPAPPLVDAAGRYALKLANETLDGGWVDMAIELHLLAVRPLREETVQQLAAIRSKAPLGTDALIAQYYERLRGNMAFMAPSDRLLCERVACLLRGGGR